jgi:uncharacterized protein YjbI with pentapeptide repeats
MKAETKAMTVSIFSVTNAAQDGFRPNWRGGRGDELGDCPFSFDENRNELTECSEALMRTYSSEESFKSGVLEGADFGGRELNNADFSYSNLRMANFSKTSFTDACFRFADLTFADFDLAELVKADLSCADLCKASLRGARLNFANLTGADLEHADFLEADLRGAVLADVDFRNARFTGALFDAQTILPFSKDEAQRLGMIESPLLRRLQ